MTICDNCIHNNVCGEEGHLDEALTYCADKSSDTNIHKIKYQVKLNDQNVALRELRKLRGFSQETLAKKCGLGLHAVLNVENGHTEGSIHFWRDIQLIFNIPEEAMWSLINGDYNIFKYRSAVADHAYDRGYADGFKAGKKTENE